MDKMCPTSPAKKFRPKPISPEKGKDAVHSEDGQAAPGVSPVASVEEAANLQVANSPPTIANVEPVGKPQQESNKQPTTSHKSVTGANDESVHSGNSQVISRSNKKVTCGKCGRTGHTKRTCKNAAASLNKAGAQSNN